MDLQNLIRECSRNDRRAQLEVYKLYAKRVFVLCRRYVNDNNLAHELVQTVFLKFFKKISTKEFIYYNEKATKAYLSTIMVNEYLTKFRGRQNFSIVQITDELIVETSDDIFDKMTTDELYRLVTTLKPNQRIVFDLFELEGYSHVEISQLLGIPETTSRTHLSRAKIALQRMMNPKIKTQCVLKK